MEMQLVGGRLDVSIMGEKQWFKTGKFNEPKPRILLERPDGLP
jgi:hypothetical protein